MRQHTKLLQRGEWTKPERTNRRNWNAPPRSKGPVAIDADFRWAGALAVSGAFDEVTGTALAFAGMACRWGRQLAPSHTNGPFTCRCRAYKEHVAVEQRRLAGPKSALAILAAVAEEQAGDGQ